MHERRGARIADRNRPGAERPRHSGQRALRRHRRISQPTPLSYTSRIGASEGARNRAPPYRGADEVHRLVESGRRTPGGQEMRRNGLPMSRCAPPKHLYVAYAPDMHCPFSSLPSHLFHSNLLLSPYKARDSMRSALPTASGGAESTLYVPEPSRTEFPLSGMPRMDLYTKQAFIARALRKWRVTSLSLATRQYLESENTRGSPSLGLRAFTEVGCAIHILLDANRSQSGGRPILT
jgi:hypothetical protein